MGRNYKEMRVAILLLFVIAKGNAIPNKFHHGRLSDGFLGYPSKTLALQGLQELPDLWFNQPLDHFNAQNRTTWMQRYFINYEKYNDSSENAPIFLMIGGEAEATKTWMHKGAWVHYAEQFGALLIQLEHRFYGLSHPTEDLSTENLRFLTSEQALADLANFVREMKKQLNLKETQKWIAFGGSYPGALAAWAREKYPELIDGSISTSGPLLAKVDFKEYYDVVKTSLASYNRECVTAVGTAFKQVEKYLIRKNKIRHLDDFFKTCTPLKLSIGNELDISNFFESLASNFAGVVQYNKDNTPHATITIDEVCDVMLNESIGTAIQRLAAVNSLLLNQSNEKCLDYRYGNMISNIKNISWASDAAKGNRQWTYQTCNEFGYYQTAEKKGDTFGNHFNVEFFIRQCMDIFSKRMDRQYLNSVVLKTNNRYGALSPPTTNVLYVHGSIDPWHALGLTESNVVTRPTIYIQGTAHCANMYEPLESDPIQLVQARNMIRNYLAQLLNKPAVKYLNVEEISVIYV